MKVLHFITGLEAGGAERSLYNLLRHYPDSSTRHLVCSLRGPGIYGACLAEMGIPVYAPPTWRLPLAVRKLVRREKPDIIQGWMYHGNMAAIWSTFPAWGSAKIMWNIRQSLYDMSLEKRATTAVIQLSARCSRVPSRIVYNSHLAAQHHETIGFSPTGRLIIPNGFDTRLFQPDARARSRIRHELGLSVATPLIGMIARYHPVKDHACFFEAARMLRARYPECAFLLAGDGTDSAAARNAVDAHGLSGHVHLLGARTDIPAVTAALDIAALTSAAEAFPNVVGEAMACGVPCVVTDVGDAASIIADTGSVVPRRDPVLFAQALEAMLTHTDRDQLGAKARKRIENVFSVAATAQMYHKTYSTLVASE